MPIEKKLRSNRMTRDQLKETIKVNFELFRNDPEFYDYITTLVIYLMKYEYDDGPELQTSKLTRSEERALAGEKKPITQHVMLAGTSVEENRCKYCNAEVKAETRICPYCLSMAK